MNIENIGSKLKEQIKGFVGWIIYFIVVFVPTILIVVSITVAYLELFGYEIVPPEIAPYYVQIFIFSPLGVLLGLVLIKIITEKRGEILHPIDPEEGDFKVVNLSPQQWANVDVYEIMKDEDGRLMKKERDKSDLKNVNVEIEKGIMNRSEMRTAYECIHYDSAENEIYTSFLAGLSPREVRNRKNSLEYVQKVLAWESDRGSKLEANFLNITRDAVKKEVNQLIHTIEGVELPNRSLTKSIERATEDNDLEYLTEKDVEDVDDQIGMDNPAQKGSVLDQYKDRNSGDSDE